MFGIPPNALPMNPKSVTLTDTSPLELFPAVANKRYYVRSLVHTNKHASTLNELELRSGTTRIYRQCAAPAGGGAAPTMFEPPLRTEPGEALNAVLTAGADGVNLDIAVYRDP